MLPDELTERLLVFTARVGRVADVLPETWFGRQIAADLARCCTDAGPSYEEAVSTQRRIEFTSQLDTCLRDLRRTRYLLRLVDNTDMAPGHELGELIAESAELCGIMEQSIQTARAQAWRHGRFSQWRATDLQFTIYGFPFATFALGARQNPPAADTSAGNEGKGEPDAGGPPGPAAT